MDKKMIYKIVPVVVILFVIITNVFGFGNGFDPSIVPVGSGNGNVVNKLKTPVQKIWGTVTLILRMCAVGGIIFTGIRYMFAGPDAKGDMKKTLPLLIVGIAIVFASTYIIEFIVNVVEEVTE